MSKMPSREKIDSIVFYFNHAKGDIELPTVAKVMGLHPNTIKKVIEKEFRMPYERVLRKIRRRGVFSILKAWFVRGR